MAAVSACELLIGGMTCTACTGAVQAALLKQPGVIEAEVDILRETCRVAYESGSLTPDSLCNVVQGLGFDAHVLQIFFSNANSQSTVTPRNANDDACECFSEQQDPQLEISQADCANDGEAQVRIPSKFYAGSRARPVDLTGTIRFGISESNEALEVCRRLEAVKGVLNCSLVPTKRPSAHGSIQLTVTYKPNIVGARQLTRVMEQQEICFQVLTEDLLQPQASYDLPYLAWICWSYDCEQSAENQKRSLYWLLGGCRRDMCLRSKPCLRLRHRMDLLVSLGSTSAYVYSVVSCIHTAVTNLWCRPLLLASAAAAASATPADTAFDKLLRNSDPQTFFDTCAMLTCVVLFGKLGAKARILTQLHSLHDLQATRVRLVQRSPIPAVASHIPSAEEQSFCGHMTGHQEQQEPHDPFMEVHTGIVEAGEPRKAASVTRWWERLTSALELHRRQHRYNPLFHPGTLWAEDDEVNEASARPECCRKGGKGSPKTTANKIQEEVIISAELLQVGDVVRVAPNEVIPADGTLLVGHRAGSSFIVASFSRSRCVGDASVLQTLLRLVYDAQQQQVPLQKTAASFASYFIPCVMCVMVAAVTIWMVKVFAASDATPLSPLQHMRHLLRETELKEGIVAAQQQASILKHMQYAPPQPQLHGPINMFLAASGGRLSPPLTHLPPAATVFSPANAAAAAAACKLSGWAVAWDSILFALRFGVAVCCAACPCAIGLAAPAAVAAATAAAAGRGIFFKSGRALETAANVNLLVFDKTGTLTTGELQVAACALDKLRVAELLMPAVMEATRFGIVKPSGKAELLAATTSSSDTNIPLRKSCCCTSSTTNTSSGSMNDGFASFSGSVLGSVSLEVALKDTGGSSQHPQDAALIQKQARLDVQQRIKTGIAKTSTPHARAEAHERSGDSHKKVAYISLKDLWEVPLNNISANSGQLRQQGSCCCSSTRDGPEGGDSALFPSKIGQVSQAEPDSETATATGCFLWALSCLEQGSNHAVGMALVSAYDRWLGAFSCSSRKGRLPQRCEEILLLPRGVEGLLRPQEHGPTLRLRVVAASSEDGRSGKAIRCNVLAYSYFQFSNFGLVAIPLKYRSLTAVAINFVHEGVRPLPVSCRQEGSKIVNAVDQSAIHAFTAKKELAVYRIFMCTGDNPRTAARVAATFGIPLDCVRAQQRPADKVAFLRSLHSSPDSNRIDRTPLAADRGGDCSPPAPTTVQERNSRAVKPVCCMIGDGLNDAPALAAAALGVAFGVGSALPVAAADVAVGGNSWTELVDLFRIAKKMRTIIQWNFLWACAFNLIAVPLAAGIAYPMVSLHPAAAAAAMAGSCLLVLLNAQRLSRFEATTHETMKRDVLLSRPKTRTESSPLEADEGALITYSSHSESFPPPFLQSVDGQPPPNEFVQEIAPCRALASTEASCSCSEACAEACSTLGHEENQLRGTRPSSLLSGTSASGKAFEFDAKTDDHLSYSGMLLA
ncbi:hypothetical protein Emag_002196 [Eimeria magna]